MTSAVAMLMSEPSSNPRSVRPVAFTKRSSDLAAHRAVTYFSGKGRQTLDWHFSIKGEVRLVKMRPAVLVNDTEAFVACALAGIGLIQAIRVSVDEHLASGRLVEVLPELKAAQRPVSIVYPSRQHVAPQVRAFIEWISETLAKKRTVQVGGTAVTPGL